MKTLQKLQNLQSLRKLFPAALTACCTAAALAQPAEAQQQAPVAAFPSYTAADALQGLYRHRLPAQAQAFEAQARALGTALRERCGQPGGAEALQQSWLQALQAWQALATPSVGPLVERRSQRQLDFWPPRPALIERALRQPPRSLADLERIGTPAKGFPALEWLLRQPLDEARCAYAALLGQDIEAQAQALAADLAARAAALDKPDETLGASFQEWVNQWLGGWERLRWTQIEQPLQKARTGGSAPAFARQSQPANLADWRTQWEALQAQAQLSPQQRREPPQPGLALVPIEALLMGKGRIALAERWAQALDKVGARMAALTPQTGAQELLALAQDMKAVTALFQNEVAPALDVPLGFSDTDGD